jgi:hypothetical protein
VQVLIRPSSGDATSTDQAKARFMIALEER